MFWVSQCCINKNLDGRGLGPGEINEDSRVHPNRKLGSEAQTQSQVLIHARHRFTDREKERLRTREMRAKKEGFSP